MTLVGTVWSPIGPSPLSQGGRHDNGLTSSIAINPNDANIIYQGTAGGGCWRSLDGGTHWTPIFDRQTSLGIGEPSAIAIDPNDTSRIYLGTSGRVTPQAQAGLYKSTDGGASCIRLGSGYPSGNTGNASQFASQWINVIIVDPSNSQILYLGSTSGAFRSTDGGLTWSQGTGFGGDVRSLVLDATSAVGARSLYAGVSGQGLMRSTNGGRTWTQILSTATPAVSTALGGVAGAGISKVVVDLAPPASPPNGAGIQVLYLSIEGTGTGVPDPLGLFRSLDQGTTWNQQTATGMPTRTQGGYSFHMAVDPASPGDGTTDIIYVGTVGQARSTDSGASFTSLGGLHPDTHAWAFARLPAPAPSTVYCGNDGGLFRSVDNGATWVPINDGGMQSGLFYNLSVKPDVSASVTLGALQDNGVQTTSGGGGAGWRNGQGGDGWDIAFDGVTAQRAYCTSGFWSPAPCTRVWRSEDDGASFPTEITPWGTTTDQGCYLASITTDPNSAGTVFVSGNQNLWRTRDAGGTWANLGAFPGVPAVAPSNGNFVVVASGSQVFVSTNALAATVGAPNGVTFTNITRNLPSRGVQRCAFDPNDPAVIYAVLGGFNGGPGQIGHVLRTTVGGIVWEDISPALDVPFGALALDGTDTPTSLYVGTDLGVLRSVDDGASWSVLDDIHFPHAPVTDLVLSRQGGVLRAATYGRGVFEFRRPQGPAIAMNPERGLRFGSVCDTQSLTLQLFNVGTADLIITSVQRLMGSAGITVLPNPSTPLVINPGEEVDFTVEFTPTVSGSTETTTIRVISNDPGAPIVDLMATGVGGVARLQLASADGGEFGEVCLGSFVDRVVVINNNGTCALTVTGISSSSPEFKAPGVSTFPLLIDVGDSVELSIRFQPVVLGVRSATLTFSSNDPASPKSLRVTGTAPAPRLATVIADHGDFGDVCIGSFRDLTLILSNSGRCPLTISSVIVSSPEFVLANIAAFPLVVHAGDSVELPVRFQPTSFGMKAAVLSVTSDDPVTTRVVALSGVAPSGKLSVGGSGHFGPVDFGRRSERTLSIHNIGKCDLHVSHVGFLPDPWKPGCHDCDDCGGCDDCTEHNHEHGDQCCASFKVVNNPFPATIHPGSHLGVLVRFTATCGGAACCELVISSDDPDDSQHTVFVTGRLHKTLRSALKCWAAGELQDLIKAGEKC